MRSVLIGCSALALILAGCSDNSSAPASSTGSSAGSSAGQSSDQSKPLTKLGIVDTKVGVGPAAKVGDTVYVEYTGKLVNGYVFDSTSKRDDKPFNVVLGGGQVIKGWDVGLVGMKAGGQRTLSIPAAMAYGSTAKGDTIPANSDLYFDVKMDLIVHPGDDNNLQKDPIKAGSGPLIKEGDTVDVDYTGKFLNGKVFDSTSQHGGKPLTVTLGKHQVIPGFEFALESMKVGEEAEFAIPPNLAYGQTPPAGIPADSWLKFDLKVEKKH